MERENQEINKRKREDTGNENENEDEQGKRINKIGSFWLIELSGLNRLELFQFLFQQSGIFG